MIPETYSVAMADSTFLVFECDEEERLSALFGSLPEGSFTPIGKNTAMIYDGSIALDTIRDSLGELFEDEIVHFVNCEGGSLRHRMLIRPRVEGGIRLR